MQHANSAFIGSRTNLYVVGSHPRSLCRNSGDCWEPTSGSCSIFWVRTAFIHYRWIFPHVSSVQLYTAHRNNSRFTDRCKLAMDAASYISSRYPIIQHVMFSALVFITFTRYGKLIGPHSDCCQWWLFPDKYVLLPVSDSSHSNNSCWTPTVRLDYHWLMVCPPRYGALCPSYACPAFLGRPSRSYYRIYRGIPWWAAVEVNSWSCWSGSGEGHLYPCAHRAVRD